MSIPEYVRCSNCKFRYCGIYECPMVHEESYYNEDDGYDYIEIRKNNDDEFCSYFELDE